MGKHDRSQKEKAVRNEVYANKFKQIRCSCGHKTSVEGRCVMCGTRLIRDSSLRQKIAKLTRRKEPKSWTTL